MANNGPKLRISLIFSLKHQLQQKFPHSHAHACTRARTNEWGFSSTYPLKMMHLRGTPRTSDSDKTSGGESKVTHQSREHVCVRVLVHISSVEFLVCGLGVHMTCPPNSPSRMLCPPTSPPLAFSLSLSLSLSYSLLRSHAQLHFLATLFQPELPGAEWVYMLGHGGGIVSGDVQRIKVDVGEGTHLTFVITMGWLRLVGSLNL